MSAGSLKVITPGKIATIRKLPGKKNRGVFDLSERAIVPIVSLVKSDPARNGSAVSCRSESNQRTGWAVDRFWDRWELCPEVEADLSFPGACSANVGMPGGCVAWIAQGMTTDGPAG